MYQRIQYDIINVVEMFQEQQAYFYLKKDENGKGLVTQAKMSTVFWANKENNRYNHFSTAWEIAKDMDNRYGTNDLQGWLDALSAFPLLEVNVDALVGVYEQMNK